MGRVKKHVQKNKQRLQSANIVRSKTKREAVLAKQCEDGLKEREKLANEEMKEKNRNPSFTLSQKKFDQLFAKAALLDDPDTPITIQEQKAFLKDLDENMSALLKEEKQLKQADSELEQLIIAYKKQTVTGKVKNGRFTSCASSVCLVNSLKKTFNKNELFKCLKCGKMYHSFCCNRVPSLDCDVLINGQTSTECANCQTGSCTAASNILAIDIIRSSIQKQLEETEVSFSDFKQKRVDYDEALKKDGIRKKLEQVFRKIGCDPRVWYQELTGNQTRKMLRLPNIQLLLSVFPDPSQVDSIGNIMKELCILMSNSNNAFKTDSQIEEVKASLERLNDELKSNHSDSSVILKLHLLSAHLMPYLLQNKQWGRISEQGLESFHALNNNFNRRHCSIKDPYLKTKLFLETHMNHNDLYDLGRFWS